jgi:hypothetical protein
LGDALEFYPRRQVFCELRQVLEESAGFLNKNLLLQVIFPRKYQ